MRKLLNAAFDCEVITPMFLGGAEPNGNPEIRPPSIRGAMRWWFRAMMGGIIGKDVKRLKELEGLVFGNTNNISSVTIQTLGNPRYQDFRRLPHKDGPKGAYRKAFKPSENFKIILSLSPYVNEYSREFFNVAKYSLEMVLKLGGFGTRSRRSFGSVDTNTNEDIAQLLKDAKQSFKNLCTAKQIGTSLWREIPPFPCFADGYFDIWLSDRSNNWENELSYLMNNMSSFKKNNNSRNAIGEGRGNNRLASPLIVHPQKEDDKKIRLLFTHFKTFPRQPFKLSNKDHEELEEFLVEKFDLQRLEVAL